MKKAFTVAITVLVMTVFFLSSCGFGPEPSADTPKKSMAKVIIPLENNVTKGFGETNVECSSYSVTLQSTSEDGLLAYTKTVDAPATSVSFEVVPATYTAFVAGYNSDGILIARGKLSNIVAKAGLTTTLPEPVVVKEVTTVTDMDKAATLSIEVTSNKNQQLELNLYGSDNALIESWDLTEEPSGNVSIYKTSHTLNPGYYLFTINVKNDEHTGLNIANDVFTIRTLANGRTFTFQDSFFLNSSVDGIIIDDQTKNTPSLICTITTQTDVLIKAVAEGITPSSGTYSWYVNGNVVSGTDCGEFEYDMTGKTYGKYNLTVVWQNTEKDVIWSDSSIFYHNVYFIDELPADTSSKKIGLGSPNTDEVFRLVESGDYYLISYPESIRTWHVKESGSINSLSGNAFWSYLKYYYPDVAYGSMDEKATLFLNNYMSKKQYLQKPVNSENARDWSIPYLSNDWTEVKEYGIVAGFGFNYSSYSTKAYRKINGEPFTETDETFFRIVTDGTDYRYYFEFPADIYDAYTRVENVTSNNQSVYFDALSWYLKQYYNEELSQDYSENISLFKSIFKEGHIKPSSELTLNCESDSASTAMQTLTDIQTNIKIINPENADTEYVITIKGNEEIKQDGKLSIFSWSALHFNNEEGNTVKFAMPIQSEVNSNNTKTFYIGRITEDLYCDKIFFCQYDIETSLYDCQNFGSVQVRPATELEKTNVLTKTFSQDGTLTFKMLKDTSYKLANREMVCMYLKTYNDIPITNCNVKVEMRYADDSGDPSDYAIANMLEVYFNSSHSYLKGYSGRACYGSYGLVDLDDHTILECIGIELPSKPREKDIILTLTIMDPETPEDEYFNMLLVNPNNGTEPYYVQYVNDTAQLPAAPSREGYSFCGWYNKYGTEVTTKVTKSFCESITAKWEKTE